MIAARATLFSIAAGVAYTFVYYVDWSPVHYYLRTGFHLAAQPQDAGGSVIFWYGWLLAAIFTGAIVAIAAPKKLLISLPADLSWTVLCALLIAVAAYEKRWFY